MKILGIDCCDWQYTVDSPYEMPMGGSQSAMCYLWKELALRGHEMTLANDLPDERWASGVKHINNRLQIGRAHV